MFLSDPGIPGVRSMGPGVSNKLTRPFVDLTDVTLADEDTNSIGQGNVGIQAAPLGDQIWINCKWRQLEASFCKLCKRLLLLAKFQDFDQISGF